MINMDCPYGTKSHEACEECGKNAVKPPEELLHTSSKADDLIGVMFVLPPHGGVVLKRYMGSDASVVEAARTSYQKGTKVLRSDEGLIHYMAGRRKIDGATAAPGTKQFYYTHPHSSPFEQIVMQFWIKLPIFLERQMVRHRTARLNEMSGRYSEMPDEFWEPQALVFTDPGGNDMVRLRGQGVQNKQGSEGVVDVPLSLYQDWLDCAHRAHTIYKQLLEYGVAKELARAHLPLSLYTQKVWQMDLNNLSRYLMLRLDSHTQQEHRDYAQVIAYVAHAVAPISVEALAASQGWTNELWAAIARHGHSYDPQRGIHR